MPIAEQLNYTGGPTISAVTPSGTISVTLPRPDFSNFLEGFDGDETRYVYDDAGTARIHSESRNRGVFRFGYRALDGRITRSTLDDLATVLCFRIVTFTPRTYDATRDTFTVAPDTYTCLVTSPVTLTRHQKRGLSMELELEVMDAP